MLPTNNDTVEQVLQRGKQRIQNGWTKGAYFEPISKCYCASGAVISNNGPVPSLIITGALDKLSQALNQNSSYIIGTAYYNDLPSTTREDIIRIYDRAIDLAKVDFEKEKAYQKD